MSLLDLDLVVPTVGRRSLVLGGCRINHLMLLMMSRLQYLIGRW